MRTLHCNDYLQGNNILLHHGEGLMWVPSKGSIFWFCAFLGVSYLLIEEWRKPGVTEHDIVFGQKFFFDEEEYVYVTGTLTGKDMDMAYSNNTVALTCYRDRKECLYTSVNAIGGMQIGRMDSPTIYDVKEWNKTQVVAKDDDLFGCSRTTITLDRMSKEVVWFEEPINQTQPRCLRSTNTIRKFTIESSAQWKKMFGK